MAFLFLLHSNQANGSTSFADSSGNYSLTPGSAMRHVTSQTSPVGDSSVIYFDGTSNAKIDMSGTAIGGIGTGDFTVDWWGKYSSYAQWNPILWQDLNNLARLGSASPYTTSQQVIIFSGASTPSGVYYGLNTWRHYAFVRSGTTLYFFVDGNLDKTTLSVTGSMFEPILIGFQSLVNRITGYITELAVRDEAIWTSAFTPPTEPYETTAAAKHPLLHGGLMSRPPQFGGLLMRN